jgi:glycosyltransferase involved in cell wall biosynthesis
VKLELWSPLPPAPSGIADHVAETLPHLVRLAEVTVVAEDPGAVDPGAVAGARLVSPAESDPTALRLYELGNSHWHGFVYREALRVPGVLRLHEWSLHGLVLSQTLLRGDSERYRRLMRARYGAVGSFVAGEVVQGFGHPLFESLFPLCEHLVERARALATTTAFAADRARALCGDRPVLHLPLHATLPFAPLPSKPEARRSLGLPQEAFVVTAPGLVNELKRIDAGLRAAGRLRAAGSRVHFVVAGDNPPRLPLAEWARRAGLEGAFTFTGRLPLEELARHLVAADAVLALRFPSLGEMSAVLLRALLVGRPTLVTAGTPAELEFPEAVVVPVDAGRYEEAELFGMLSLLARRRDLGETIGRRARRFALAHHDPAGLAERLLGFLEEVAARSFSPAAGEIAADDLAIDLLLDVRRACRELGLGDVPDDVRARAAEILAQSGT